MAEDTLAQDIFSSSDEEEVVDKLFNKEDTPPDKPLYKEDGKPPPDRKAGPRASGEDIIGGAVAILGTTLVNRRIDPPVGRIVQLQAPITAKKVDVLIANTFIDKLLQPLFKKTDQLEGLGAVVGLPILIGLFERRPEMGPILWGPMEDLMGATLEELGKSARAQKAKRRRAFKSADLANMLGIDESEMAGMDPAEFMLKAFIFQPPEEGINNGNGNVPQSDG